MVLFTMRGSMDILKQAWHLPPRPEAGLDSGWCLCHQSTTMGIRTAERSTSSSGRAAAPLLSAGRFTLGIMEPRQAAKGSPRHRKESIITISTRMGCSDSNTDLLVRKQLQMGCESTTTSPWTDVFNGFGPYALIFDQAAGCNSSTIQSLLARNKSPPLKLAGAVGSCICIADTAEYGGRTYRLLSGELTQSPETRLTWPITGQARRP